MQYIYVCIHFSRSLPPCCSRCPSAWRVGGKGKVQRGSRLARRQAAARRHVLWAHQHCSQGQEFQAARHAREVVHCKQLLASGMLDWRVKVHVCQPPVLCDPCASLLAQPGQRSLQGDGSRGKNTGCSACCPVFAQGIHVPPTHAGARGARGRGNRSLRSRRTRK